MIILWGKDPTPKLVCQSDWGTPWFKALVEDIPTEFFLEYLDGRSAEDLDDREYVCL